MPPGHYGDDVCNPEFQNVHTLAAQELAAADVVIVCGLSGRDPDEDEVKSTLDSIRPDAYVAYVALECDRNEETPSPTWRLLKARGAEFVLASDVHSLSEALASHFDDLPWQRLRGS